VFGYASAARLDRREGKAAIGVDVGGTKVAFGLLDACTLELLAKSQIPTKRERGGESILAAVKTEAAALAATAAREGRHVVGLGLAMPEIVDLSGSITSSVVIPQWDRLPVGVALGAIAPVRVDADVRAAAFAEAVRGAGRGLSYYLYLIVGTGISYCAVHEGRPIAGAHGGALNIGTSILDLRPGSSDNEQPVLERIASGSALVERYVARGGATERAEDVLKAAQTGDRRARDVIREGARALGVGVALLVNLLDPEAIIVGGGLGSADTDYWNTAERWARRHMYSDIACAIPIHHAQLGPDGGVIGAGLVGLLRG
jgi:glucokinase